MEHLCYRSIPTIENYFQPKTISEAVSVLDNYDEEAKILAGGTDLVPLMRARVLKPKYIVDLSRILELDYIRYDEAGILNIGALATLRSVETSEVVKEKYRVLYEAVHQMASIRIRNVGTVAGNICRASPSADTAPSLMALESEVKIIGPAQTRAVPIKSFFLGPGKTVLKYNEVVCEIRVPAPPAGSGTAFRRISRTPADLATVSVTTVLTLKNGVCQDAKIALGGVAPTPISACKAEEVLKGSKPVEAVVAEAAEVASREIRPITDVRSTAEYRTELCKTLVRQAIINSLNKAQKGDEP